MHYFKKFIYCIVLIGISAAEAGSYEDFFQAVKTDNPHVIQDLLKRGFDPNSVSPDGHHALILAVRSEAVQVAKVLIEAPGTRIETRTAQDESALMLASLKGYLDLCKKLIERDADINKTGWTPLHYAATKGHVDVIKLLLDHHAYPDAESPNKTTPLMMAARYGTPAAVKALLDAGADPTLKNSLGLSALEFATSNVQPDSTELIAAAMRARTPKGAW
jgi:ankyrin repeat protein